jgi:hypothetical protein
MAFTPEDGTGLADANSYATVAEVTAYLTDRNRQEAWEDLDQEVQEAALVAATDYVESVFGRCFKGWPENPTDGVTQALHFPATGVYDRYCNEITGVPTKLKQAIAEYADRIAVQGKTLAPDPVYDDTADPRIKRKREKVGPIEEETEFHGSNTFAGFGPALKRFPAADRLLRDLVTKMPSGRSKTVIRN